MSVRAKTIEKYINTGNWMLTFLKFGVLSTVPNNDFKIRKLTEMNSTPLNIFFQEELRSLSFERGK